MAPSLAVAKPAPIRGKLTKPNYTVIAMEESGEAKIDRAPRGKFAVRPPDERVALHLQARDGTYAGPVVVGDERNGKRALVGVRAGAKLGEVKLKAAQGYAKLEDDLAAKGIDGKRIARAKKGVPIGAGNFGFVRSKVPRKSPPGDLDADGVADPLDIDANGNLVIDRYEQDSTGPAGTRGSDRTAENGDTFHVRVLAVNEDGSVLVEELCIGVQVTVTWPQGAPVPQVGKDYEVEADISNPSAPVVLSVEGPIEGGCPASRFIPDVRPGLALTLRDTVNLHATGATPSDLDATLRDHGLLLVQASGDPDVFIELDCAGEPGGSSGGLSYCTPGGTGRAVPILVSATPPRSFPLAFPDCCDSNANGFGELRSLESEGQGSTCFMRCVSAFLSHGATTEEIGPDDILRWWITKDGKKSLFTPALSDVFATVPALVSYDDDGPEGNPPTRVSYQEPFVGSAPNWLGGDQGPYQGFSVAPCPADAPPPCVAGEIVVTLEFWRPQREAIGAEVSEGPWRDIGGLLYSPGVSDPWARPPGSEPSRQPSLPFCQPGHLSTTDSELDPVPEPTNFPFANGYGFRDTIPDRQPVLDNTLSFSVNLTRCLRQSWDPGQNVSMWLMGSTGEGQGSGATQQLLFTRE